MAFFSDRNRGFTIIELLIALVVLSIIISAAVMYLTGKKKKQDLLDTGNGLVDTVRRAQSQALAEKKWFGLCFKSDSTTGEQYVKIYDPELTTSNYPSDNDCSSAESAIYTFKFKPGIEVCTNCDANIALDKSIFFNRYGRTVIQNGTPTGFEICLINGGSSGTRMAREVEVTSMGIVKMNKLGDAGFFNGVVTNSGNCQ